MVAARGRLELGGRVLLRGGLSSGRRWARPELHVLHLKVLLTDRRLVKGINSSRFNGRRFGILNRRQSLAMVRLPSRMVLLLRMMPIMMVMMVMVTVLSMVALTATDAATDDPWNAAIVRRAGKHDTPNEGESQKSLAGRLLLWLAPLGARATLVARIAPWRGNMLAAPMTKLVVATATLHSMIFFNTL